MADDNADMLSYIVRILKNDGFGVISARDGEEALTVIRNSMHETVIPLN